MKSYLNQSARNDNEETNERAELALPVTTQKNLILKVVPTFMQRCLTDWVFGRPSYWVKSYFERRVEFIIRCVEPLADPRNPNYHLEFSTLCRELAETTGPQAVAERVGKDLSDDYPFHTWEEWAEHAEERDDNVAAVYCWANSWLQLDFRAGVAGAGHWRDAWSDWENERFRPDMKYQHPSAILEPEIHRLLHLAANLQALGAHSLAVVAFTDWLTFALGDGGMAPDGIASLHPESSLAVLASAGLDRDIIVAFTQSLHAVGKEVDESLLKRFTQIIAASILPDQPVLLQRDL